ncbi:MAG: hypothetical protein AABX32_05600 [Nanoarchaeota archaeon]
MEKSQLVIILVIVTLILTIINLGMVFSVNHRLNNFLKTESPSENLNALNAEPEQQVLSVQKSAKPTADLFVMSYCPYGLQMEKVLIPVAKLLGDKADIKIRWVSYAMHGQKEVEENLRQYCIQKEQSGKYWDYLICFVTTTDTESCQKQTGIDTGKLSSCYQSSDKQFGIMDSFNDQSTWLSGRFPQFNIDKSLNQQYGVQGSPTFILNGKEVAVSRNPESVKAAICSAFLSAPSECKTQLSSNEAAPGAGPIDASPSQGGNMDSAGCGV